MRQKEAALALLASDKVDFTAKDHLDKDALVLAVQSGSIEMLRALVGHEKCTVEQINGSQCLDLATMRGSLPMVALLCAQEGITIEDSVGECAATWYQEQVKLLPDYYDKTSLWARYIQLADLVGYADLAE